MAYTSYSVRRLTLCIYIQTYGGTETACVIREHTRSHVHTRTDTGKHSHTHADEHSESTGAVGVGAGAGGGGRCVLEPPHYTKYRSRSFAIRTLNVA